MAALNVKYRDFRYVIPFAVQALLFLTPVIYPVSVIQNPVMKFLLALNPMNAPITIFRIPLTEAAPDMTTIWVSLASGLLFFFIGLTYFRKTETYFADLA